MLLNLNEVEKIKIKITKCKKFANTSSRFISQSFVQVPKVIYYIKLLIYE